MKRSRTVVVALLLLLGLSMFTFFAGRDEPVSHPSADNVFPSGLGALTELLRLEGYSVVVARTRTPKLEAQDMVVAAYVEPAGRKLEGVEETTEVLRDHVLRGGRVLKAHFAGDFAATSRAAKGTAVRFRDGRGATVTSGTVPSVNVTFEGGGDKLVTATTVNQTLLTHERVGQGILATLSDGLPATNRFLGQEDNAKFVLDVVKGLARPTGKIVFVEATLGRTASSGLLEDLGPWAQAAWWQGALLFLVCVYTLGKRIGAPEREFSTQRSSRQLVDALAAVLKKGRQQQYSAQVLADEALDRMRSKLKLPVGTSKDAVILAAPREFADAYAEVFDPGTKDRSAAQLLEALETMDKVLADTPSSLRSQS